MQSLPLTIERQQSEWKTIQAMARNNNFQEKLITNLKTQMQQKLHQKQDKDENKKMGNLYTSQSTNYKNHQSLQTYQHNYCIQKHKHNAALYKTKDTPQKNRNIT